MKTLTNRRNKNTVRGNNNRVVFYKTRCAAQICDATQLYCNLIEIPDKNSQISSF